MSELMRGGDIDSHYRAFFEKAADGMIVTDESGSITDANEQLARMFGYTRRELLGQPLEVLLPEPQRDRHRMQREFFAEEPKVRAMAPGRLVAGRSKDGRQFPLEISLSAITVDGAPFVMAIVRDLTKHMRAEEHFDRFFSMSHDLLALVGFDGYLKRINPAWEHATGFTAAELLARPVLELVDPIDADSAREALEQLRSGLDLISFDVRMSCRDGAWRWIEWTARPVTSEGLIYAVGRDVTERRRADVTLRETVQKLQAIFDSSPLALIGVDLDGRVTSWSAGAHRMFGWFADEVIGKPNPTVPADEAAGVHAMIDRVVREGSETGLVVRRVKANGELIHAGLSAAALQNETGEVSGVLVILEDITRRLRAEETLREYSSRLRLLSQQLVTAQEAERRRVARELHDEIGQALTAVEINLRVARTSSAGRSSEEALEESVTTLERVLQRIRELSIDLHPPVLEHLGLPAALRWHADRQTRATGLTVRVIVGAMGARPPADVELACFRIAQESLTNVIRHANATLVEIELYDRGDTLELIVRDNGGGFDLERARSQRTSLGLIGMEERVSHLGGQFTICSSHSEGTEVRALLPVGDR